MLWAALYHLFGTVRLATRVDEGSDGAETSLTQEKERKHLDEKWGNNKTLASNSNLNWLSLYDYVFLTKLLKFESEVQEGGHDT